MAGSGDAANRAPETRPLQGDSPKKPASRRARGSVRFSEDFGNRGRPKSGFLKKLGDCQRFPRAPIPGRAPLRGARFPRRLGRVGRRPKRGPIKAIRPVKPASRRARGSVRFPEDSENRGRPKSGFPKNTSSRPRVAGPDSGRVALRGARFPRRLGRVGRRRDPGARNAAPSRRIAQKTGIAARARICPIF